MRILHVIESLDEGYGGPARSLPFLMSAQKKNGNEVLVVSVDELDARNDLVRELNLPWCPSKKTGSLFYFSFEFLFKLRRAFKEFSPDVVHVHSVWSFPSVWAMFFSLIKRVPYFLSPRSSLYSKSMEKSGVKKSVVRLFFLDFLISRSSGIHVTEDVEEKEIKEIYKKTRVIKSTHGINLEEMRDVPGKKESCKELCLDDGYRYALFLSRVHPRKNVHKLIDSWIEAGLSLQGWRLLIVGGGEDNYLSSLKVKAKSGGYEADILFFPFLSGELKKAAFGVSEFFVLPSSFENFGMAVGEAMAASKPVVVGVNSPWVDVESSRAGYAINPEKDEIKKVLCKICALPSSTLEEMGVCAKKMVSSGFSWEKQALDLDGFYRLEE